MSDKNGNSAKRRSLSREMRKLEGETIRVILDCEIIEDTLEYHETLNPNNGIMKQGWYVGGKLIPLKSLPEGRLIDSHGYLEPDSEYVQRVNNEMRQSVAA